MIATIDFEASGPNGYPIEVGIAIHDPARAHISVWSSLIKPTVGWLQTMSWDPVAVQMHGIARADLKSALHPFDIGRQLNTLLGPIGVAYCDGWKWDHRWLFLLMEECPEPCRFQLGDAGALGRFFEIRPSALFERDDEPPLEHRAGSDAERLLRRALKLADRE